MVRASFNARISDDYCLEKERNMTSTEPFTTEPFATESFANVIPYPEAPRPRHMAVMFVDLDHFMRICIDELPEAVFGLLSDFQHVVTDVVSSFRGELNSYQGDGVLATFGDAADRADCATRTLRCARTILEQVRALRLDCAKVRSPSVSVSIGLQYGQVWTSTINTSKRFGPTIIGDAVNVAARLEQQAGTLGAKIVAGADLIQRARRESASNASELAQFVNAGPLFVRGRRTPVDVWKLQIRSGEFLLENASTVSVDPDVRRARRTEPR
jgi:adenylate cyclase